MEYFLIVLSTVLFGGQFIALDAYQAKNGKSYKSILLFCSLFAFTGAFIFLALNGFIIGFSVYTLLMSLLAAGIQMLLQFAGLKALSLGRVEIYSLFNVAGGMSVAYIFGITYFQEAIKWWHIIGLVLILLCLLIPVIFEKKGDKKSSWIFWILCIGVFLANGFFGTINKMHIVSGNGLSIKEYMFYMYSWIFIISTLSFFFLAMFNKKEAKELWNYKPVLFGVLYGLLNGFGMFMQYMFADTIPASILFPLSNAGCIVFSLIIGCIAYRKKPKLQDIAQIVVALIGMSLFFF
ncbi:MAG: hypothetical protein E7181_03460 [Erysipelotrichaceae bacterium]|nr:hypothetical protein [Erysipelotrichaceae bacterium]